MIFFIPVVDTFLIRVYIHYHRRAGLLHGSNNGVWHKREGKKDEIQEVRAGKLSLQRVTSQEMKPGRLKAERKDGVCNSFTRA